MKKFKVAFEGLLLMLKGDRGVQIQFILGLLTIIACLILKISLNDWMVILLCIGFVLVSEILNTAIEKLCDLYTTDYNPKIKYIKDISAAAVLLSALISLIIMLMIILKYGGITR